MELAENLRPSAVALDLRGEDIESVIKELADLIAKGTGESGIDSRQICERLLSRERMLSTAMGCGIAFPHCTSPQLKRPAFALGVAREGIDGDAPDSKPVHVFFVIISPAKDPNAHLEALAAASKIFVDPGTRDAVLAAKAANEAIAAMAAAERKIR